MYSEGAPYFFFCSSSLEDLQTNTKPLLDRF